VTSLIPQTLKASVVRYGIVVVLRGEVEANDTSLHSINESISRSTSFSRIRLQVIGNGIIGFKPSGKHAQIMHISVCISISLVKNRLFFRCL